MKDHLTWLDVFSDNDDRVWYRQRCCGCNWVSDKASEAHIVTAQGKWHEQRYGPPKERVPR